MNNDKKSLLKESQDVCICDVGDGIVELSFTAQDGTISSTAARWASDALKALKDQVQGVIITSDGDNFCTGINTELIQKYITEKNKKGLEEIARDYQSLTSWIKSSKVPIVTAVYGQTLDYGVELAVCSDAVIAAADVVMGFQIGKNGCAPVGGGMTELTKKVYSIGDGVQGHDIVPFLKNLFGTIYFGVKTEGVQAAKQKGFLPAYISVTSTESVNSKAKTMALFIKHNGDLSEGNQESKISVTGSTGKAALDIMAINAELGGFIPKKVLDISSWISWVICGGNVPKKTVLDESRFLDLEVEAFVNSCLSN